MTRPLRSTSTAPSRGFPTTTSRSASASRDGTHCLAVQPLGRLPLAIATTRTAVSGHAFPRSIQEQQTGLTSPTCRTPPGQSAVLPPGSSRADLLHPGFDATLLSNDTSAAIPENEDCAPSFRSPPDASRAPFPHRSPRRSSANAACGGLQPPTAGRLRTANLHLLHSTMSKSSIYKQNSSPRSWHTYVLKPDIHAPRNSHQASTDIVSLSCPISDRCFAPFTAFSGNTLTAFPLCRTGYLLSSRD